MDQRQENLEIIRDAVNKVQNKKTPDELDFEREVSRVDTYLMGWDDE